MTIVSVQITSFKAMKNAHDSFDRRKAKRMAHALIDHSRRNGAHYTSKMRRQVLKGSLAYSGFFAR